MVTLSDEITLYDVVDGRFQNWFQGKKILDDELEHSSHGIGDGTEYGYDALLYAAATKTQEQFLQWLEGMILLLDEDFRAAKEADHPEIRQWELYLQFLRNLKTHVKKCDFAEKTGGER